MSGLEATCFLTSRNPRCLLFGFRPNPPKPSWGGRAPLSGTSGGKGVELRGRLKGEERMNRNDERTHDANGRRGHDEKEGARESSSSGRRDDDNGCLMLPCADMTCPCRVVRKDKH